MSDTVMFGLTVWAAVCQTLFVALYLSRPWWRLFVGRALFTKSLALAVLFDIAIARHYFPAAGWLDALFEWTFLAVVVGITLQLAALVVEVRNDWRKRRARS